MTRPLVQFSLRWLLGAVTIVAVASGLYAAFPRAVEFAFVISFILFSLFAQFFYPFLEKRIWIISSFGFAVGTWMILVAIFRAQEAILFLICFAAVMYMFGVEFLVAWLRRLSKGS